MNMLEITPDTNISRKLILRYSKSLMKLLPQFITKISIEKNDIIVYTKAKNVKSIILFLKNHSHAQYKILTDLTAVDYISKKNRFQIVYNLLSLTFNTRIIVKLNVNELTPVDSIVSIHSSAGWYEREVWDLFGVFFLNHPDLRRILTDYGFEGHPLKKDFPLSGFTSLCYNEEYKRVVTESVEFSQESKNMSFSNPWNKFIH